MIRFFGFATLVLLPCFVGFPLTDCKSQTVTKKPPDVSDSARQACSVFDVPIVNAQAWEKGDFLVKERYFFDGVKTTFKDGVEVVSGALINSLVLSRNVFDYENKKLASFEISEVTTTDFDHLIEGKPRQETRSAWRAGSVDFKSGQVFKNSSGYRLQVYSIDPSQKPNMRTSLNFRDYRGYWLRPNFQEDNFKYAMEGVNSRRMGFYFHDRRDLDPATFRITMKSDMDQELITQTGRSRIVSHIENIDFDQATLMPTSHAEYFEKEGGERVNGDKVETIWQLLSEVYVPRTILLTKEDVHRVNQVDHSGSTERQADFHWFSLNQDLDNAFFDGSLLKDQDSITKLVLPIQAGATELISPQDSPPKPKPSPDPKPVASEREDSDGD